MMGLLKAVNRKEITSGFFFYSKEFVSLYVLLKFPTFHNKWKSIQVDVRRSGIV